MPLDCQLYQRFLISRIQSLFETRCPDQTPHIKLSIEFQKITIPNCIRRVTPTLSISGVLDGGPQCRMSNLRNVSVSCPYFFNIHVDLRKGLMSHVEFKELPISCH